MNINDWCFRPRFCSVSRRQLGRMRWILLWIMPLEQDRLLDHGCRLYMNKSWTKESWIDDSPIIKTDTSLVHISDGRKRNSTTCGKVGKMFSQFSHCYCLYKVKYMSKRSGFMRKSLKCNVNFPTQEPHPHTIKTYFPLLSQCKKKRSQRPLLPELSLYAQLPNHNCYIEHFQAKF